MKETTGVIRGKTRHLSSANVIKKQGSIIKPIHCCNIVEFIHEKRPEVNVSFCPNDLGQNETHIKCTEIFKKIKSILMVGQKLS